MWLDLQNMLSIQYHILLDSLCGSCEVLKITKSLNKMSIKIKVLIKISMTFSLKLIASSDEQILDKNEFDKKMLEEALNDFYLL